MNLIVTSTLIVYIGSHKSLRLLVSESEGGAAQADKEVLSAQDAYRCFKCNELSSYLASVRQI